MSEPQPRPRPLVLQIIPRPDPVFLNRIQPPTPNHTRWTRKPTSVGSVRTCCALGARAAADSKRRTHASPVHARTGNVKIPWRKKRREKPPVGFSLPSKAGADSS